MAKVKAVRMKADYFENGRVKYRAGGVYPHFDAESNLKEFERHELKIAVLQGHAEEVDVDDKLIERPHYDPRATQNRKEQIRRQIVELNTELEAIEASEPKAAEPPATESAKKAADKK